MTLIRAEKVVKRFGRTHAVDGVSFEQVRGEALALWGGNGTGKTTLMRCLLGVLRFGGRVEIDGVSVRRSGKRARSMVGYVPQELAFHDDARVGVAMGFFARLRSAPPGRVAELLGTFGLGGETRKRVRDLSGGMKQRLALCVALLSDPPIVLLDEPTSNLDVSGRREVLDALLALKRRGKTIVFASHRPDEVLAVADRVLAMETGRIVEDAAPRASARLRASGGLLRLHVEDGESAGAAELALREAGHAVTLNGAGLCVRVAPGERGAPLRTLARASIDIRDFELLDPAEAGSEGGS